MFLFLKPTSFGAVVPWSEQLWRQYPEKLTVPYIEAGHPGSISLKEIAKILRIRVVQGA